MMKLYNVYYAVGYQRWRRFTCGRLAGMRFRQAPNIEHEDTVLLFAENESKAEKMIREYLERLGIDLEERPNLYLKIQIWEGGTEIPTIKHFLKED